jgi:hypothetical protein
MTYWTILWITIIGGDLDGKQGYLLYPDMASCMAAHQTVAATLPYDFKVKCEESDTPSGSIRPKRRP